MEYLLLFTQGFLELPEKIQGRIIHYTLNHIKPDKPDWIVFYPDGEERLEDGGRTLITSMAGLKRKVYAILDDYGDPETLRKYSGLNVNTRYAITFLLADEY